ncbi:MAG: MotA/TolQ/ExbB proton channel family protein [Brevinema sp.]
MEYLLQGGWVMLTILLSSIIGLAVFFERLFYLHTVIRNADIIKKEIQEKFRGIKIGDAILICNDHPGTASNIIKAGLQASRSREEMERAMEDIAKYELPKLNQHLPILATIINISTLLGLLGTVLGMITSTSVLASQGLNNPQELIGGIAQALVTTAAGLIVSIPALIAYNYLSTRIDYIILSIEASTTELIKVIKPTFISSFNQTPSIKKW